MMITPPQLPFTDPARDAFTACDGKYYESVGDALIVFSVSLWKHGLHLVSTDGRKDKDTDNGYREYLIVDNACQVVGSAYILWVTVNKALRFVGTIN
jgi:hypothetical protein